MQRNFTPLIVLITAMVVICGGLVYQKRDELKDLWSWCFLDKTNKPVEAFVQKCFFEFPSQTATKKILNLRHCVNINSTFSADKIHYAEWQNPLRMMQWLAEYERKKTPHPPPMECFYRAHALSWALKSLGFQSHIIVITSNSNNLMDHVVVRVFNPDTKRWEIQDPLYDIKYILKKEGRVLGMRGILKNNFEDFEPCDFKGKCGWDIVSREKLNIAQMKTYLSSAYDTSEKTLYLSRNFDAKKTRDVFGKKMSFCQKQPDFCKKIVYLKPPESVVKAN